MFLILLFLAYHGVHTALISPRQSSSDTLIPIPPDYRELFYDQTLDHYNFNDDRTFKQRYLLNDDSFSPQDGCILFYAGSDESIIESWSLDLFLAENALRFKAIIVFAEHRFYGKSLPFGNKSLEIDNIVFLTIEQTLADYAKLIQYIKESYRLDERGAYTPVIVFGGAYGGLLSTHLRLKYPTIIDGAISSAASMDLIGGHSHSHLFYRDVTKSYKRHSNCINSIRSAFDLIQQSHNLKSISNSTLQTKFKLCKPLSNEKDYRQFLLYLRNALAMLAVNNYPYAKTIHAYSYQANPVQKACETLAQSSKDTLAGFHSIISGFYNRSLPSHASCFDIYSEFLECADSTGCMPGTNHVAFDYQSCTEIPIIQESNHLTDMFPTLKYTQQTRKEYCKRKWNVSIRDNVQFAYWNNRMAKTASNLAFIDSTNDPWSSFNTNLNDDSSIVSIKIQDGGAHKIDLKGTHPNDTNSIRMARLEEIRLIEKWIRQARQSNQS